MLEARCEMLDGGGGRMRLRKWPVLIFLIVESASGQVLTTASQYTHRGFKYTQRGEYYAAIAHYTRAIELDPDYHLAYNNLAWLLVTCSQQRFRDGEKAVEYARKACELTQWKDPHAMDTLAAAYAEAGNFDEAIKWENNALKFPVFAMRFGKRAQKRLQLYRERKPYRDV